MSGPGCKLRDEGDGIVSFFCPACKEVHTLNIKPPAPPAWTFNWNYDKPTFFPSILVKSGHYASGFKNCWGNFKERYPDEGDAPFKCYICHSFIKDGRIQFLSDCTHELAGKTVDLPDFDDEGGKHV